MSRICCSDETVELYWKMQIETENTERFIAGLMLRLLLALTRLCANEFALLHRS